MVQKILWNILLQSILLLVLNANINNGAILKMTNAVCESYNKSWVVMGQCRLKAVQRNKTILNIDLTILYPANDILVRMQILRKGNSYKPWLFDITIDGCKFIQKRNNPAIKMVWELFKDFSTINHTCPYYVSQILKDFYPSADKILNPFPTGEYLLILTYLFKKHRTFDVKVYFSYVEDLI